MGGQLDGKFPAGSLPHKFTILIVTSFVCLWSIIFFSLCVLPKFFYLLLFFNDFCQTNLNIYLLDRSSPNLLGIGRTVTKDERPEINFSILYGTSPWQPIFLAFIGFFPQKWVRVPFAQW